MNSVVKKIVFALYRIKYQSRRKCVNIAQSARVYPGSSLEGYNKLGVNSYLKGNLGRGSYIGANSVIIGDVGRFCSIAENVSFITKTHPTSGFVSTSPSFYSLKRQNGLSFVDEQLFDEEPRLKDNKYSIEVGNDVYIGYGVTIIGPCKIGDGAIIAANATVAKDVEPYSIVGGVPAKRIKMRFEEDEIEFLQKIAWWDKDIRWLQENAYLFTSISVMKNKLHD